MKKLLLATFALGFIGLVLATVGQACSRIFWNDNGVAMVTARTLDWAHSFEDFLMVIPRGEKMNGGLRCSPKLDPCVMRV